MNADVCRTLRGGDVPPVMGSGDLLAEFLADHLADLLDEMQDLKRQLMAS